MIFLITITVVLLLMCLIWGYIRIKRPDAEGIAPVIIGPPVIMGFKLTFALWLINDTNANYLYQYKNWTEKEVVSINTDHVLGKQTINFILTYKNGEKLQGEYERRIPQEFVKPRFDFILKDVDGEGVWRVYTDQNQSLMNNIETYFQLDTLDVILEKQYDTL